MVLVLLVVVELVRLLGKLVVVAVVLEESVTELSAVIVAIVVDNVTTVKKAPTSPNRTAWSNSIITQVARGERSVLPPAGRDATKRGPSDSGFKNHHEGSERRRRAPGQVTTKSCPAAMRTAAGVTAVVAVM